MSLDIKCYPNGMYGENTYLVTDEATGFKAIIDPGYYDLEIRMDIQSNAYLKYLILTHGHHDHFLAAQQYKDEYSAVRFAVPEKDIPVIEGQNYKCPKPNILLKEGVDVGIYQFGLSHARIADRDFQPPALTAIPDEDVTVGDVIGSIRQQMHHQLMHEIGVKNSPAMGREFRGHTNADIGLGVV